MYMLTMTSDLLLNKVQLNLIFNLVSMYFSFVNCRFVVKCSFKKVGFFTFPEIAVIEYRIVDHGFVRSAKWMIIYTILDVEQYWSQPQPKPPTIELFIKLNKNKNAFCELFVFAKKFGCVGKILLSWVPTYKIHFRFTINYPG